MSKKKSCKRRKSLTSTAQKKKAITNSIGFTMMPNEVLYANLSNAAVGLYGRIASLLKKPNFKLYKSYLIKQSNCGECSFNKAWKELKNKGYLKQYRVRRDGGFDYQYELLTAPDLSIPGLINVKLDGTAAEVKTVRIDENTTATSAVPFDMKTLDTMVEDDEADRIDLIEETEEKVKEQIRYDWFVDPEDSRKDNPYIETITDIMVDVQIWREKTINISGKEIDICIVRNRFNRITSEHIEYITGNINETSDPIVNIKGYLTAALWNAASSLDVHNYQYSY